MSKKQMIAAKMEPARAYVNQQIETMRKHGAVANITPTQYDAIVRKVARATSK